MLAIEAENVAKVYKARVKEPGLRASVRALIRPEYRTVEAVSGISFSVARGERVALIGPNGAGKSTTIKMLTGILYPSAGRMRVEGLDPVRERDALCRRIGTVFGQKSQLWFHLPPADSFELLGAIYDLDAPTLQKRVRTLTERFELGELLKTPVRKLSLGQRMRCEVAASLLHDPDILFLDEPTIGLDVLVKRQIRELILEMNRERGATVFLTSHDSGDVEDLCERALVIDHGRIMLDAQVSALKAQYLRQKAISIRFEAEPQMEEALPAGVLIESRSALSARLLVDTAVAGMDEVMRWLIARGAVADVTVENPPMERVIAAIFEDTQRGGRAS